MSSSKKGGDKKPDLELLKPKGTKKEDDVPIPQAKEGKSEDIFEVAEILEHLLSPDGFYMKVRWLGYGPDEDSWEPEEDLLECASECVQEYNATLTPAQHKAIEEFKIAFAAEQAELAEKKAKKKAKRAEQKNKDKKEKKVQPKESPKVLKRPKYEESDQESNASDASVKMDKKKAKKSSSKKITSTPSSSNSKKRGKEEKVSVPTKAALKLYDTPSSARKAAISHRQNWLDSGSDSDEDEKDDKDLMSFDEEIKAKVLTKKKEVPAKKTEAKTVPSTTCPPKNGPQPSSKLAGETTKYDVDSAFGASVVSSSTVSTPDSQKTEWIVDGFYRKVEEDEKKHTFLLTNSRTGEKKVVTAEEAHELAGFNLYTFFIDRCVFA